MAEPLYPKQRNSLDDILNQAFDDLELENQRQQTIVNAPDPAQALSDIQKVEKQTEAEPEPIKKAVRTSYYTGQALSQPKPQPMQSSGKPRQPISEAMYNELASGSARVGQGLASAPGFIYGLASYPQRQLAKIPGLESLADGTREMEEYLSLNPVAKYYKDTADQFAEESTRYDQKIVDYIKQGNLVDAIGLTGVSIVGSIPYTASMIAGGYAGVPAKLMVPTIGLVTGGEKNSTLLEEMPEFADDKRTLNALVDGLAEGTFEQLGSAGIGRTLKTLLGSLTQQFGRKKANEILTETIAQTFKDKTSRLLVPKAMNLEGWTEVGTTVMQNLNAQLTGEDPNRDLFEGAVDAYIVGAGSAGALTAPAGIAVSKQRKTAKDLEKAKAKGLDAIDKGTLRQLTDQDINDFASSLTIEEAMELGVVPNYEKGTIEYEPGSAIGSEIIRRQLQMEKAPETERDFREAGSRANIKEQKESGTDFVGAFIDKANEGLEGTEAEVNREYLDRELIDEIQDENLSEEQVNQIFEDQGIAEGSDVKELNVYGRTDGYVARISTAGTEERMADEYIAVQEEMAEIYYNAEMDQNPEFDNEVANERKKYHEKTGEVDKGESNIEWFSSMAIRFGAQGKVHKDIGLKLKEILKRFMEKARIILKDSMRLRKAIQEGKVSQSLISKLEQATDFKSVGKSVKKAQKLKKVKKKPTFRLSTKESYELHETSKRVFGTTEDPREAGYILLDGEMLDFSGKNEGGTPGTRSYDHRQINTVGVVSDEPYYGASGEERWSDIGMVEFIQSGAIRYMPESNKFHLGMEKPDQPQLARLRQLINNPPGMETLHSSTPINVIITDQNENLKFDREYKRNTPWEEIKRDVLQFYRTGKGPSITQQFHSSYRISIAEGMEKLKVKPALTPPSKNKKLSANQVRTRIKRLKRNVIPEIESFAKNNPEEFDEAINWYFNDIRKAIDIASKENSLIKEHPAFFTALICITSNGQKVQGQYNDTVDILSYYKDKNKLPVVSSKTTGKIPKPNRVIKLEDGRQLGGVRPGTIGQQSDRLQYIIDQLGLEGAEKWLLEPKSGIEIHRMAWDSKTKKGPMAGISADQKNTSKDYRGMHIFGRKIGNFGLAFWELNREPVIDVWMARWFNRHMGTPYLKGKKLAEAPRNPSEWNLISKAVGELTKEFNKRNNKEYNVSQIQAVIWYHEKFLYEKNGINFNKGINYSRSANERSKQKGYFQNTEEFISVSDASSQEQKRLEKDSERVSGEKPTYRIAPTWYSKAERVVTEKFPPTMKSQSVVNWLKKSTNNSPEIEWLDLETLFKGKPKVTKQELQEWIQANKIEVEDVMLGESFKLDEERSLSKDEFIKMFEQIDPAYPDEAPENTLDDGETLEFVEDGMYYDFKYYREGDNEWAVFQDRSEEDDYTLQRIDTDEFMGYKSLGQVLDRRIPNEDAVKQIIGSLTPDATKHSSFQLPGKREDYKELLLTLPTAKKGQPLSGYVVFKNIEDVDDFLTDVSAEGMEDFDYGRVDDDNYKRVVFKNIPTTKADDFVDLLKKYDLQWYSTNDDTRKKIDKKNVFISSHYDEPNILAHVRFNTRKSPSGEQVLFIEEVQSDWHTKGREKGYKQQIKKIPEGFKIVEIPGEKIVMLRPDGKRMLTTLTKMSDPEAETTVRRKALSYINAEDKMRVPDAPFKKNGWIELIMKRMLRYASDNNFDRIAWTTSNQQIDRWRNSIRQNVDQISYQKLVSGPPLTHTVVINGLKKNKSVFNQTIPLEGETTINGQRVNLEGLLGKQMATQIRNSDKKTGVIEGDNLTIGGEGFKVVYDMAIKKILNKMGKKYGAKVDQVKILETSKPTWSDGKELTPEEKIEQSMPGVYSEEVKRTYSVITQPSIRITRKMKESALKGQPTFRISKMASTEEVQKSESFKKWFKGSKVKDKNGKPLVVYHGTTQDFDEFKGTNFFTVNPDVASTFSGFDDDQYLDGGKVYPVYLSLKNPSIVDFMNKSDIEKFLNKKIKEEHYQDFYGAELKREIITQAKLNGNDGLILKNNLEPVSTLELEDISTDDTYVTFEPTQIKSIFNKGTYNPHDPRISFHIAPKNLITPLAKFYQEQKGTKKSYTKKDFEMDLARNGYSEDDIRTIGWIYGIITSKQFDIDDGDKPTIQKNIEQIVKSAKSKAEIKNKFNILSQGFKKGASTKKQEIVLLQSKISRYASDHLPSGGVLYGKADLKTLLKNIKDGTNIKKLRAIFENIDRLVAKAEKRDALSKWNKVIKKKAKVKKVRGVTEGTVGADVQETVWTIKGKKKGTGYMDLTPDGLETDRENLLDVISKNEDGEPTEAQAWDLYLLQTFGNIKDRTAEEISKATLEYNQIVTDGRTQVLLDQIAYKERMGEVTNEILEIITGGAGPQTQSGAQKLGLMKEGPLEKAKKLMSTFDSENQSLEYIFDKLSKLDKTSKPLQSYLNQYFMPRIRQARLAEYNGLSEMMTLMTNNAERIFKLKGRKLTNRLNKNTTDTITIEHNNGRDKDGNLGSKTTSTLTYNQAYKKWMELQDPTMHPTFERMGYHVNKVKRQIESQLPKDMIKWAEWQLYEFYPMYYSRVNETFRKRFKVNMPFNPYYSPIKRRIGARADEGDDTLNKSKSPMGSMTSAGSLKSRVSNTDELAWIDGDTTLLQHITEMEHFIHYTDVMRELRTVFMNQGVSISINDFHGSGISRVLNKFMDDIARGGVDRAQNLIWMDKLRANFSRSVIGVNPVVYLKQLASIPAYMADIPVASWSKEFAKTFNPIEFKRMYRTLTKSEMLKMRYDQGFERDMVLALQNTKPGKMISGTEWVNTFSYAFTKMGDKQAIFLGGWAVYKYHFKKALKAGKSRSDAKKIAMKEFESASLRSQQASDVEDLADFQRRGSLAKLFTMFMTSPNQYYRMVIGGYRNLSAGRGSRSENLRRIFVGQLLLPNLFAFIGSGFEWDKEEQLVSTLLFPFAGMLFVGKGTEYMIRSIFNKAYPMGPVSILDPFVDFGKAFKKMFDGKEYTTEKIFKIIDEIASGISKVTGLPYSGPMRSIQNTIKVIKDGSDKPIREGLGFRFDKEPKSKKKKFKVKPGL